MSSKIVLKKADRFGSAPPLQPNCGIGLKTHKIEIPMSGVLESVPELLAEKSAGMTIANLGQVLEAAARTAL